MAIFAEPNSIVREGDERRVGQTASAAHELLLRSNRLKRLLVPTMGPLPQNDRVPPPGIYLAPGEENTEIIAFSSDVEASPRIIRGKSAHGLVFGSVTLRNGAEQSVLPVAIKPFKQQRKALIDATHNVLVLQRGIRTTIPVAVIAGEQGAFVISHTEVDVQSLDTLPWRTLFDRQESDQHMSGIVQAMSNSLARINARGIRHGDVQLRNFWLRISPVDSKPVIEMIDWETSEVTNELPDLRWLKHAAVHDCTMLCHSLLELGRSMPQNRLAKQFKAGRRDDNWALLLDLVIKPYLAALQSEYQINQSSATAFDQEVAETIAAAVKTNLSFSRFI